MKKVWSNPEIKNLGVEYTKDDEPIIETEGEAAGYKLPKPDVPDLDGTICSRRWVCPCCGATSGYRQWTRAQAIADYYSSHTIKGKCMNRVNGACPVGY